LRAGEGVALPLQGLHHIVESVGVAGDLQGGTVGLKVGGTGLQSVHHDGVFVQLALLVVNDDDALLVKGPADAALGTQVAVALVE
ncbi:30S ribosomal protein S18, partial [Dysosmobacter welbionis]